MSQTVACSENLASLAKDLRESPPSSPRKTLAGYVMLARIVDKCRAELVGYAGEYRCLENSRLDQMFLEATGIEAAELRDLIATGASNSEIAEWIKAHSKMTNPADVAIWNNTFRNMPLNKLPIEIQIHFEKFITQQIPPKKPILTLFDKFDIEEGYL